jgi:hypothetical protein
MKKIGWNSRLFNQQPSTAKHSRFGAGIAVATLLMTGICSAQSPAPAAAFPASQTRVTAPDGYAIHQTVNLGGHITGRTGSQAMYDTLVNVQSGPRLLGESFEMHALPGKKNPFLDNLSGNAIGFGGDPNNFAKLDFSKARIFEFSANYRRDRQYFDYDLLGNPNIPGGQSIPIGPTGSPTGSFAWPQVNQSPVMFNTVRRMTDTSLTLFPLSDVTFRAAYSRNVFDGPSLSPGASSAFFAPSIGSSDAVLMEYQRNVSDDYTGGIDWKPLRETKLTYEEQIDHYKADSYFNLAASDYNVQESDGTKAALNDYDSQSPFSSRSCNANSIGTIPMLSAPTTAGGLPVINPACPVVTSYLRTQPTRILTPTEIFRLQSSYIKNISMNGDIRYTSANMKLPSYFDGFQGLNGTTLSLNYTAVGSAKRQVLAADYGIVWQATKTVTFADQASFSSTHQPGTTTMTSGTKIATPATAGNEVINYAGTPITTTSAAGASTLEGSGAIGTPLTDYFGQNFLTNNLTGTWDVSPRATVSLTYRYGAHTIAQGSPHNQPLAVGATANGTVTIHENGGIFTAALRPTNNWNVNGSVEVLYADNSFTPVGPRQTKHYRVHTVFKPKSWATLSAAFNDLERHNNTNNNQAAITAGDDPYEGPIGHVDYSRVASLGAVLLPNEHYGFTFNYAYSDVYTATNICYDNGATATLPGTASLNSSGTANVCPGVFARGSTTQLADWFAKDFMDAPTQYASAALSLSPIDKIHSNIGYRISSVAGNQFFNDARAVNGSLQSAYQSPYVNLAYTVHKGLVGSAEYNFYGYGEGGASGPQLCSTSTTVTSTVVPCTSLAFPTGLTESPAGLSAPRNFHANNLTVGLHYEF